MTSEPSSTPKSPPSKKERDATVEAVNHLIQGKRHLLVQDVSSAVNSLQEACRILAACYGELADECGDAYYHYGVALLELSRKESGVLGNQKEGSCSEEEEEDDDDEEDDGEQETGEDDEDGSDVDKTAEHSEQDTNDVTPKEKETLEGGTNQTVGENDETVKAGQILTEHKQKTEKVESKPTKVEEEIPNKDDSEATSEDLEDSKKADEGMETENKENKPVNNDNHKNNEKEQPNVENSNLTMSSCEAGPSTSSGSAQPAEGQDSSVNDEDDVSSLQLAWEVLELAKVIFQRQSVNNREMQLRLAQVHSKLGEVAMESENYKQSIEDLLKCYNIQHSLLPTDDRCLAESFYQLGLAYCFDLNFDSSIESFQNAVKILRDRIHNLQAVVDAKGNSETTEDVDAVYNAKKEVEELNSLIPEILEKITDTEDLQKNSRKLNLPEELDKGLVPERCQEEQTSGSTVSPVKNEKPTTNIGHLVRKKRKPEEGDIHSKSPEDNENKRSRSEKDVTNDGSFENNSLQIMGGNNIEVVAVDGIHSTQSETSTIST